MKIKLNRALWNKSKGEEMIVPDDKGIWAINKGLAEQVIEQIKPKELILETKPEVLKLEKKKGRPSKK